MKAPLLTAVAVVGLACSVLSQGYFVLDNTANTNGFVLDHAGNWYTGGGGLEVWEANAATASQIDAVNSAPSGVSAYALLALSGFKLEGTLTGASLFSYGSVSIGSAVEMPDVSPPGGTVTVALTAWNTADASASSAIADATGTSRLGVYAFAQLTADYLDSGARPEPPGLTWAQGDLVMTSIPEPGTLALVVLGVGALWFSRRRR